MIDVLYEDNHLLAMNKPAGLATMGVDADTPSAFKQAQQYIKTRYEKPGKVYLGVVSRLDAAVSGVLLFARTSKAAARLAEQFAQQRVEKTYWALVSGKVDPPDGELIDWLYKDEARQRMAVARHAHSMARRAVLRYRTLQSRGRDTLVEIELLTGRKHQIRLQLSARGLPIRGDKKYGSRQSFARGIALHARRLVVEHPTLHQQLEIIAPLSKEWPQLGIEG